MSPGPYYLNSDKLFLTLSNQYRNPEQGFEPRSSSECLLEFDTRSKPLGYHGRLMGAVKNDEGAPVKSTGVPHLALIREAKKLG